MKRAKRFKALLLCFLSCICLTVQAQVEIYGFSTNIDDEKQSGLIKFSSTDPANTMQRVKAVEEWATAGAWGGDAYYAILSYATYPKGLYTIDIETGESKQIADYMYNEKVRAAIEMSYDFTTETMYMITVSDEDEYCTAFGTINLRTGEQKIINANMGQYIVAMAINKNGRVYGINDAGFFVSINKETGKCTNRYSLEVYPWRKQSMEFDRKSGELYWAYCDTDDFGYLKKIKVNTGTVTDIGYIGGMNKEQVQGLYIPYSQCEDGAPHKVTNLTLTPDANGMQTAILSWNCPTTTYAGDELTEIEKIEIYRNETLVVTLTDGVSSGATMTWTDNVNTNLECTYKIVPYNSIGSGLPATISAFVGHDTPSAAEIASVTRIDNNSIQLTWHPVRTSANKGYLDKNTIKYKVTRVSDGTVLAESLTDTTYTDNTITEMGRYQYAVTVSNVDGEGEASLTGYIVNGPARTLPLKVDFTNETESQLWSIADADSDGQTYFWQYNPSYKDQGFFYYQCEYAPTGHADDWLLSPEHAFDANKAYKVLITARPCNIYRPEKMLVYLVKDYDLSTAICISDTLFVDGEEDETGETIMSLFRVNLNPLDEAGEYSVGIRCVSDFTEAYWLALSHLEVSENQEGHIRGDVYDNELNPVEGVVVSLEGTDYSATTDARGQFEIRNISEGTYTSRQTKMGYFSIPQNISVKGLRTTNVELDIRKRAEYNYSGQIKNEYGEALPNATVVISGYNNYTAITNNEGNFSISGVYELSEEEENYQVEAQKDFYETDTTSFTPANANNEKTTRNFVLNDLVLPPAYVTASINVDGMATQVIWSKPAIETHVRLHSDNTSYTFGSEEGEAGTLIGLVCREAILIDSLHWWTFCDSTTLNVVILALDNQGRLTSQELYRDDNAPNNPYNKTTYRLKEAAYAPNGCFISISVDKGNLAILTTGSTDEYPFVSQTNAYIEDIATAYRLEYVEELGSDYEENYYMSYSGRRLADAEAPTVTYNIIAKSNDSELYRVTNNDFFYTDYAWRNLGEGNYQYAIETVYRNGKTALIQTPSLTKTTSSAIQTAETERVIQAIGDRLIVSAENVRIVSANGQTMAKGIGPMDISIGKWSKGLYIIQTQENGLWHTFKYIIK